MKIVSSWAILVATVIISFNGCALKKDLDALNEQMIKAEKDQLEFRSSQAELRALMNDLRDEMVQLRGEQEKGQYYAKKSIAGLTESEAKQAAYREKLEKSHQRVVKIEQYLGLEPSENLAATDADHGAVDDKGIKDKPEVQETPEDLYARAKQLFDRGEYEDSRELFRSLLKQYPTSKMAGNAQFWLGEIYYHEKWYEKAILEYQKVIENFPKGNKTPGALLKQGFAFLSLDDKANAKLILKELIRKFPGSNEADVAKNKLKTLK